jgi:hypothetical protein
LKTNHKFDTLVLMIDKMGMKDEINQAGTFFAVTNYSIRNFILARETDHRTIYNNENLHYTFDSLDFNELKDTLRTYLFADRITRDNISQIGLWRASKEGDHRWIQMQATSDYTNQSVFTTTPKYMYLTKIIEKNGFPVPADSTQLGQVDPSQLLTALCQTTGILTTTGVLHVLNDLHTFNYYGDTN